MKLQRLSIPLFALCFIFISNLSFSDNSSMYALIPAVKEIKKTDGQFEITPDVKILEPDYPLFPIRSAAQELADLADWKMGQKAMADDPTSGAKKVRLLFSREPITEGTGRDGYRISIKPDGIVVTGNFAPGLYYGIQTLAQLVEFEAVDGALPCMEIIDEPDFPNRGFYHDVTRGKVPTLETLKELADLLARYKMNQMQLYVEHTFAFTFDPRIAQNPDGLTAEEIRELDAYCADRYIDLVPSLQSFGHMAGALSLPEYRDFAEVPLEKPWEELTWHQRMKGVTLDTTNPEARALMKRMLDEFLPLFDSKFANVCADETYDLGRGKSAKYAEEIGGPIHVYLEHMNWLNEICKSHGKRMMFWGDIVKKHPEMIPEIPKDAILLNWGYSYKTDFDSSELFQEAGLDFYVCPGTSGWNDILNRIDNADLNIRGYAEAGMKYGAIGLLNTNWGDHGHYNTLAGSLHGIVLGAAMAWNVGTPEADEFDRRFSIQIFGDESAQGIATLRRLSFQLNEYGSWIAFYKPADDETRIKNISNERAEEMKELSEKAVTIFEKYADNNSGSAKATDQDIAEFIHMSRMMGLLGEKILIVRALEENKGLSNPELGARLREFADETDTRLAEYRELWLARNKPSDLAAIEAMLQLRMKEYRTFANELAVID